jgi:hypothetical protein
MTRLHPDDVEAIAARVAELLRGVDASPTQLLTAAQVARRLGVTRATVYARADELGAVRPFGDGPKARLRFDPARVDEALRRDRSAPSTTVSTSPAPRRTRRAPTTAGLLPIRGGDSDARAA